MIHLCGMEYGQLEPWCKVKEGLLQENPNILDENLKQPLYRNKNSQMKQENYGAFNQSPNFTKGSLKASKLEICGRGKTKIAYS